MQQAQKDAACVNTLGEPVEASDSKYSKNVSKAARAEEELCTRITSLVLELKIERACIVRFEKNRINEHTKNREVVASRQKASIAMKNQLREIWPPKTGAGRVCGRY